MIVPIGRFCGIVIQLNRLGLRTIAYPFDWMVSSLPLICDLIETDFKDFFDVVPKYDKNAKNSTYYMYRKYLDKHQGLGFPHHDMAQEETKKTFLRRIER